MYTIISDHQHRLLRITLSGFWSDDEAKAFARDQQDAVRKFGPPVNSHLTLADVRGWEIQTQEVSAIIRDLVVNAASTSKRIALVGSEGLFRLQLKRIVQREGMRLFDSSEEAEVWLKS